MSRKIITKSSYLSGIQCPKLFWIKIHEKHRIPEVDETAKARFKQGYVLEDYAKKLFPEGIDAQRDDFVMSLSKTKDAVKSRKTIFEGSFLKKRLYSRADVLKPVEENKWDIYEIKSSTRVKEVNLHDVSFQKYVYEQAGLEIRRCYVIHINNEYVYDGENLNPNELFKITDITEEIEEYSKDIEAKIERLFTIIDTTEPVVNIGAHCNSPYECDMKHECWAHVPEDSVFDLHNTQEKCFELYAQGVLKMKDIPLDFKLSAKQLIQKATHIEQTHHVQEKELKEFLDSLEYPLYYLDFETINPGIPKYKDMKPYQRIPFQYSLHIQETPDSKPYHKSFLHKSKEDPRKKFLEQLKEDLRDSGSIIVFNKQFEKSVLKESVSEHPEFNDWLKKINNRMIDLMDPFKKFQYYHPKQNGSTSIKKVLPVFSDLSYDNLTIGNGQLANIRYEEAMYTEMNENEKEEIFKDLEEYCFQDTLAEVKILEGLKELIN